MKVPPPDVSQGWHLENSSLAIKTKKTNGTNEMLVQRVIWAVSFECLCECE